MPQSYRERQRRLGAPETPEMKAAQAAQQRAGWSANAYVNTPIPNPAAGVPQYTLRDTKKEQAEAAAREKRRMDAIDRQFKRDQEESARKLAEKRDADEKREAAQKLATQKRAELAQQKIEREAEREAKRQQNDAKRQQSLTLSRNNQIRGLATMGMGLGSGALDLLKNISILSVSGEKDIEKLAKKWVMLTSAFEAGKGAISVIMGITKALDALRKIQMATSALNALSGVPGMPGGRLSQLGSLAKAGFGAARGFAMGPGGAAIGGLAAGELLSRQFSADGKGTLQTGWEAGKTWFNENNWFGRGADLNQQGLDRNTTEGIESRQMIRDRRINQVADLRARARQDQYNATLETTRDMSPRGANSTMLLAARDRVKAAQKLIDEAQANSGNGGTGTVPRQKGQRGFWGDLGAGALYATTFGMAGDMQQGGPSTPGVAGPGQDNLNNLQEQVRATQEMADARREVLDRERESLQIINQELDARRQQTQEIKNQRQQAFKQSQSVDAQMGAMSDLDRNRFREIRDRVNGGGQINQRDADFLSRTGFGQRYVDEFNRSKLKEGDSDANRQFENITPDAVLAKDQDMAEGAENSLRKEQKEQKAAVSTAADNLAESERAATRAVAAQQKLSIGFDELTTKAEKLDTATKSLGTTLDKVESSVKQFDSKLANDAFEKLRESIKVGMDELANSVNADNAKRNRENQQRRGGF